MPEEKISDYDRIAYPNFVHPQTHPNRLATMARAFGLKTAPVEKCRVLEIGCGGGTNLLAMACRLPESEFVGIDLSENHINYGKQAVSEIGVGNLKLVCADILQIDFDEFGTFDYIIAHGFFSWIPPQVREKLLSVCRENLSSNGVAFVSYNAFPGCHLRLMMREMMRFHTREIESPTEMARQSVALLGFLREAAFEKEIYGRILQNEFEKTAKRPTELIFHDDLAEINQPFYFHEFIAEAEKFDLQFLSEAEYFSEKYTGFNSSAVKLLDQIGDDVIRREQYLDFLKNRRFRQTLLCHKNISLKKTIAGDFFDELQIASDLRAKSAEPDFSALKIERFEKSAKDGLSIDHPLSKSALFHLGGIFPRSVSFEKLVENSTDFLRSKIDKNFETSETDREILKDMLLKIFASNLVEFFVFEPQICDTVSEKPQTDAFIRWQAQNSETIFTRRFRTMKIEDDFVRNLLTLLDGEHRREDIIRDFREKITGGRLKFDAADDTEKQKLLENLPEMVEDHLRQAAKLAILTA